MFEDRICALLLNNNNYSTIINNNNNNEELCLRLIKAAVLSILQRRYYAQEYLEYQSLLRDRLMEVQILFQWQVLKEELGINHLGDNHHLVFLVLLHKVDGVQGIKIIFRLHMEFLPPHQEVDSHY